MKKIKVRCPKCGTVIQLDADALYVTLTLRHGEENALESEIIEDEDSNREKNKLDKGEENNE